MSLSKQDTMVLVKKYSAITLLLIFVVLNCAITPNFFQIGTLNNIIMQVCPTILCGMGMTLVISTGGIDISVGSIMALSGVLTAQYATRFGILPAIVIGILASLVVGCISGFFVGELRLQAMVITLGMQLLVRGLAQVLCGGRDIYFNTLGETGSKLALFGSYKLGGVIPVQVIPIVVSLVVVWILVEKMVLGRQSQAVGDNSRSSALAGIHTARVMMFVYACSAFFAALAGIFQSARVTVAAGSSLGQLAELDAIAAVVIGGTPMSGGKARVIGTLIGALIMQMITLTCVMNNIPDQYAQVFKAVIIVVAVFIQREQAK